MMLRRYHKRKSLTRGYGIQINSPKLTSIAEMSVKELKELCKERGLKGYSKMNEAELIALLSGESDA